MKTILVATDFSPAAENAAHYAANMAMFMQADLLLLNIFEIPINYYELPMAMNSRQTVEVEEKMLAREKAELERKIVGQINIRTEVRVGAFFEELKAVCELVKPYTVVMGSQGTTAAERILFGGHAVHAMQHLHWPLITVPPDVSFSSVKKICLACDLHNVLNTIPLEEIRVLVNDFQSELHILNTGKKNEFTPTMVTESGFLQSLFASLRPKYHFITSKDIDNGIIEFCERNEMDLLVVIPKRHTLLEKLIYQSHTKTLVLHSHVPVMAIH